MVESTQTDNERGSKMRVIHSNKARQIAYAWHSGQWSPLYAFASSGIVSDLSALLVEINKCLQVASTASATRELNSLARFCKSPMVKFCEDGAYRAPWVFSGAQK